MNVIGKFGNFMMNHQVGIEILLILIFVLIAVFLLVRGIIHANRKRQMLSEIQDTVNEINTAVQGLGEKKDSVIYIDNRTTGGGERREAFEEKELSAEEILQKVQESAKAAEPPKAESFAVCEEAEIPKKYFSRDCGTSKTGRTYTIEELEEQIKE